LLAAGSPAIVTFGDSLSDPGNHFIVFHESARQPYEPVPSASYDVGGHHFSNGPTWIEQTLVGTSLAADAGPAWRGVGPGQNYAVGRARARSGAPEFPAYDLSTQVSAYLARNGGVAQPENFYLVWIGGNDIRDAIVTVLLGGGSPQSQLAAQQILGSALTAITDNVLALYASGARTFVILNVPNPAVTPAFGGLPPIAGAIATQIDGAFNGGLLQSIQALSNLPGAKFIPVDVDAAIDDVLADPAAAGFDDVVHSCLTFGVVGQATCEAPDHYLFWDATHPTRHGHEVIARAVAEAVDESR
jgi:phospholipase/lecithinase/hemolysin